MRPGTEVEFVIKNVKREGKVGSLAFNISSTALRIVVLTNPLPSGELAIILPESELKIPYWVNGT